MNINGKTYVIPIGGISVWQHTEDLIQ
jgi:hypothetical protein